MMPPIDVTIRGRDRDTCWQFKLADSGRRRRNDPETLRHPDREYQSTLESGQYTGPPKELGYYPDALR